MARSREMRLKRAFEKTMTTISAAEARAQLSPMKVFE